MDASDKLRTIRDRFVLPEGVIYLDGNSLGALPGATAGRVARSVEEEWGRGLIRSWNEAGWIGAPARVGARIAPLIGAGAHEVIVADSTSVNLFKLLAGAVALRPGRRVLVGERGNFPTNLYIAQGVAQTLPDIELRIVAREDIPAAIDRDVAAVFLTHVHYKSGARFDMRDLTARAHADGALMLWDLSHSAGAVALDLNGDDVDLAVGCGYKYLNGGPGAPAFLFVAERHLPAIRSPLSGWMGHAAPFEFSDKYEPDAGIGRLLCGTPSIIGLAALESGLDVFRDIEMANVATKAARLTALFIDLVEEIGGDFGLALATPRDADRRGAHVSFAHPEGYRIMHALIERGVIGDFRAPDILRFGFAPLYVRYEDVWRSADVLRTVLATEAWREDRHGRRALVT